MSAKYKNGTTSQAITTLPAKVYGVIVNSHSSGTLRFNDGASGTTSAGVKATGVLTGSDVFTDGEQIVIGTNTYTMVDALSGASNEVLIGASLAVSLDNLKLAINATDPETNEGVKYGVGTVANPNVTATTNTDTAQTIEAIRVGTYANSIATTTDAVDVAWGAGTLENGANASLLVINTFTVATGSQVITFPEAIDFASAVFVTVGGTIDYTVVYEPLA